MATWRIVRGISGPRGILLFVGWCGSGDGWCELDSDVSSFDGLFLFFSMVGGEMVMFVVLSVKVCVGRTVVDVSSAACRLWIPARAVPRSTNYHVPQASPTTAYI
jgi:hypothetical protein